MNIIDTVNMSHDLQAMLNRAIATLVDLYTAKPHFIYELLQNAEDAEATRVVFIEKDDCLQVLHNGRPFTARNLTGLTDIGLSDKLPETNKIGKFGVGFKSVFTICKDLYVASEPSHWKGDIRGVYPKFSAWVTDYIHLDEAEPVDIPKEFTTFFQFGYFVNEKRYDGFTSVQEIQETIAQKLMDIGNTTLLFLRNIQTIEYRIEVAGVKKSGSYTLDKKKISAALTDVIAKGETNGAFSLAHYLKFTRPVKIDNVERSVDIAFKVETDENEKTLKFVKPDHGSVSVYFPTGTVSGLNFIVQGPFRTTPNRSEVLRNSPDNAKLVAQVAFLLRQAIVELKNRKLVTAEFLNMLPFDARVFKHLPLFASLVDSIRQIFTTEAIFPGQEGGYWSKEQIFLARNNEMAALFNGNLLTELVGKKTVWTSTKIKEFCDFGDLFNFMKKEIGVAVCEPESMRRYYTEHSRFLLNRDNEWLVRFYKLYSKLTTSCFVEKSAGSNMLSAYFVKTADGRFVSPRRLDGDHWVMNIFRPSSSKAEKQVGNVVDSEIYAKCRDFFNDTLRLPVPTDCDVFLSDFIARYEKTTEIPDEEHIADLKKLLKYLDSPAGRAEVEDIVGNTLKLHGTRGADGIFRNPKISEYMLCADAEGQSLVSYFDGLTPLTCFVDQDYYATHGIAAKDLLRLGVTGSIVVDAEKTIGEVFQLGGSIKWQSLGKFRRDLMLSRLPDVLCAIERRPDEESSREKSKIVYHALVAHADALRGKTRAPDGTVSEMTNAKALSVMLNEKSVSMSFQRVWNGAWLYSKDGMLCSPSDIKIGDLDESLYGKSSAGSMLVDLLGFQKTKEEEVEKEVSAVSQKAREVIFESELKKRRDNPDSLLQLFALLRTSVSQNTSADIENAADESFPIQFVNDIDRLRLHVMEMLACAGDVRYVKKLRSVRESSIGRFAREYLKGYYGFPSGRTACQLCQKSALAFSAVGIFPNPKLELEPIHLCLCRNCEAKYKEFQHDEKVMENLWKAIDEMPLSEACSASPIEFKLPRRKLWFTPKHFAEVKLLMELQK